MATIGNFLLACNKYIPCLIGSVYPLKVTAAEIVDNFKFRDLPLADQRMQNIFRECVTECGLNPNKYVCKIIENNCLVPAQAVLPNTIIIRRGESSKNELWLRMTIKHELGHLNHYDAIALTCINLVATAALYGASWMMEQYLQDSSMGAIAAIAGIFSQLPLNLHIQHSMALHSESRADQFSIKHTRNSQELRTMASYYEERFENWVAELPTFRGGKSIPMVEFENRENRNQTLREWVIENRHMPYAAGRSMGHPNYYDRAQTFRLAAERLEANDQARALKNS